MAKQMNFNNYQFQNDPTYGLSVCGLKDRISLDIQYLRCKAMTNRFLIKLRNLFFLIPTLFDRDYCQYTAHLVGPRATNDPIRIIDEYYFIPSLNNIFAYDEMKKAMEHIERFQISKITTFYELFVLTQNDNGIVSFAMKTRNSKWMIYDMSSKSFATTNIATLLQLKKYHSKMGFSNLKNYLIRIYNY